MSISFIVKNGVILLARFLLLEAFFRRWLVRLLMCTDVLPQRTGEPYKLFQNYDRPVNWVRSPLCSSKEVEFLCGCKWNISNSCSMLIRETKSILIQMILKSACIPDTLSWHRGPQFRWFLINDENLLLKST